MKVTVDEQWSINSLTGGKKSSSLIVMYIKGHFFHVEAKKLRWCDGSNKKRNKKGERRGEHEKEIVRWMSW